MGLISRVSSRTYRGVMLNLAKFQGLRFSLLAAQQQTRSVATVTPDNKGRRTVRAVTSRYQRTGAGIWFRNLAGRSNRQWAHLFYERSLNGLKMSQAGARRSLLTKKLRLSMNEQKCLNLDLMVNRYHRQQKWTVENPYKGYTRFTKVWYYPGRPEADPAQYQRGYWNFGKSWSDKSDHTYDNDNAFWESKKPKNATSFRNNSTHLHSILLNYKK